MLLILLAQSALALNPPASTQAVSPWSFVLDMNTPNNPADDAPSGVFGDPYAQMNLDIADCGTLEQPSSQPKPPDACGTLDVDLADTGFWLYYDGDAADAPPGGWNASNSWWRNRLIFRYAAGSMTFLGRYRQNPAHPDCLDTDPCPSGTRKFCGSLKAADGPTVFSGGKFNACLSPL